VVCTRDLKRFRDSRLHWPIDFRQIDQCRVLETILQQKEINLNDQLSFLTKTKDQSLKKRRWTWNLLQISQARNLFSTHLLETWSEAALILYQMLLEMLMIHEDSQKCHLTKSDFTKREDLLMFSRIRRLKQTWKH